MSTRPPMNRIDQRDELRMCLDLLVAAWLRDAYCYEDCDALILRCESILKETAPEQRVR